MTKTEVILQKYFEENSLVTSNINSFNAFIEKKLQEVIEENKDIEPTIIPHNIDEFKIRFDKITVKKPEITEADGSRRLIYPQEARLRKISYAAPVFLDVSSHVNGTQRESFTIQIASIPIMLKSKYCNLHGLSKDDLVKKGEDPNDPGGYFVINGTEKVLITIEDLMSNKFLVEKTTTGPSKFIGKMFSEKGAYKIPHTIERLKDGIFYMTFTRVKRVPVILLLKALGMTKDEEIMKAVGLTDSSEIFMNLYEFVNVKDSEEAVDLIAKRIGITQAREIRVERMSEILDKYLLSHIGIDKPDRLNKAYNICKMLKKFIHVQNGVLPTDDKDHYANKRLKLSGDLLEDLFRVNLKVLIGDMLYNFQRIVKRGKFPSIKVIIRDKLLTSRIYSSMATGNWVGGRKGISQRMDRLNFLAMQSHLQRVISPLQSSQENFEARALHATHLGRLCPVETPEGTNIGLRKNMALLSRITQEQNEQKISDLLIKMGVKSPKAVSKSK